MYIKDIVISGFRSYRDQKFEHALSPKHNVIVGGNGAGKSNFLAAVRFVLSDVERKLDHNDRRDILHRGAGRDALAAFVEIIFDNSDHRFVIPGRADTAEVKIRRTVGLKQDEYRVNDHRFSPQEVRQLLETAGFSASNPYYIVEQGKVVNLASMKETDRYKILKDVAGTNLYEAKKLESEKLLEETAAKRVKIDEAIGQLDERLRVLEAETSELKSFEAAERKRRSLEYCIHQSELKTIKDEFEKVEAEQAKHLQANDAILNDQATDREGQLTADRDLQACIARLAELEQERKTLEAEHSALTSKQAVAQLRYEDAKMSVSRGASELTKLEQQEKELKKGMKKSKDDFEEKRKAVEVLEASTAKGLKALSGQERELEILQAKRGRKVQFSSKAARDAWISEELKRMGAAAEANRKEIAQLDTETGKLNEQLQTEQQTLKSLQTRAEKSTQQQSKKGEHTEVIKKQESLNMKRRDMWQQIKSQEGRVKRLTDDHERAKQRWEKSVRLDIRQGLQSLHESLREIGDSKLSAAVHGQLIQLIDVEGAFEQAVEITAGNAIFNVVVDSFDVSARILNHMNQKKKQGRVTFFPLDTCKGVARPIPTTAECSPLIAHINCQPKFRSVIAEVFGRTAVVATMEAGLSAVRDLEVDAITMDGDQFNRKGGITGGYSDRRNGKLTSLREEKQIATSLEEERAKLNAMCQEVAVVEQQLTTIRQTLEQQMSQEAAGRKDAENDRAEIRESEEKCHRMKNQLEQSAKSKAALEKTKDDITHHEKALRDELKADFQASLTKEQEAQLESLQQSTAEARAATAAQQSSLVSRTTEFEVLRTQVQFFEDTLSTVTSRIASLRSSATVDPMLDKNLEGIKLEVALLVARLDATDKEVEQCVQNRKTLEENATTVRSTRLAAQRKQQDAKDMLERWHTQRGLLLQRKEEALAKVRKLGVIPTDADTFANKSLGMLMGLLKATHEELRKYAHVNKKAMDQYTTLVETRNDLKQQCAKLEKDLESIQTLMVKLEEQKGDAITRTYKQIQFNFEQVFKELVQAQGASAKLELVRNPDTQSNDPFSAVRMSVSFGLQSAVTELAQLSGGQKSLVALAFIFAIQRCDPAPFYLFDEIDAALDAEYRTSVARMIESQSEHCQFITVTFKTEMLRVANSVFGIFYHNMMSQIKPIPMEKAKAILSEAAMNDRKRTREDEAQKQD